MRTFIKILGFKINFNTIFSNISYKYTKNIFILKIYLTIYENISHIFTTFTENHNKTP